jgi:hypothetical protein
MRHVDQSAAGWRRTGLVSVRPATGNDQRAESARRPAGVVPAPPWCTAARLVGKMVLPQWPGHNCGRHASPGPHLDPLNRSDKPLLAHINRLKLALFQRISRTTQEALAAGAPPFGPRATKRHLSPPDRGPTSEPATTAAAAAGLLKRLPAESVSANPQWPTARLRFCQSSGSW